MMAKIVSETKDSDLTMSGIASRLESSAESEPIDQEWLKRYHPAAG
jgi:pyruvate-ferredoxin/flavodoxin oxidoreductase